MVQIEKIKCKCGGLATHHHSGNHFCVDCARDYAQRHKRKNLLFAYTPNGREIS